MARQNTCQKPHKQALMAVGHVSGATLAATRNAHPRVPKKDSRSAIFPVDQRRGIALSLAHRRREARPRWPRPGSRRNRHVAHEDGMAEALRNPRASSHQCCRYVTRDSGQVRHGNGRVSSGPGQLLRAPVVVDERPLFIKNFDN